MNKGEFHAAAPETIDHTNNNCIEFCTTVLK